uniref:Uncharacterized protein n=1 Tax=Octopus bimaculoides TaxID=37653 RepID=A0A0L8GN17_OCTBM
MRSICHFFVCLHYCTKIKIYIYTRLIMNGKRTDHRTVIRYKCSILLCSG